MPSAPDFQPRKLTPAEAQELLHAAEEIKAAAIVASPYYAGAPVTAD